MFDIEISRTVAFTQLETRGGPPITDVSRALLLPHLEAHGAVLLRGFSVTLERFAGLVDQVGTRTAIDPARAFFAHNVQLVDAGTDAVGLHCENGNTPSRPDVVWFYSAKAAARGSQTTVCDGYTVWDRLSARVQDLFRRHQVTFARSVPEALWTRYLRHEGADLPEDGAITQEMINRIAGRFSGTRLSLLEDRSLRVEVTVPMAHETRFGSRLAFANSLLGPSYNYQAPRVTLDDGAPIPAWALEEVEAVTSAFTYEIPWEDGDVIAIDNSRVMHGRREILDTDRRLYTALSFL